ncbi:hypothetical protein O6H91_03G097700 [Diphasiastrum complanatum]|uniref:Uncharacterized protein n=1 Tax=Diphasiastrum complanatum TaxID=34168 RepID=A0ACC2E961_DIPCM|nr:hypothetical protein O6H91_03G097700 [Diphasiastrum complanatum]
MDGDFQVDLMDPCPGSQGPFVTETMSLPKARVGASTNDQRYLLVFILGTYFGPDIRDDVPRKSALQRQALRLPLYSSDELGGSVFKLSEIESIYYYVLRHSHPSARVKLQSLYKFLQGHLAPPVKETLEDDRQFTSFFPPHLHRQSRYKGTYKVVENMVFINDPELDFFKLEDIERFKRLSGLNDLVLDRDAARSFQHGQRTDRDEERQARFHAIAEAHGHVQESRPMTLMLPDGGHDLRKKRKRKEHMEMIALPTVAIPKEEKSQWASNCKMTAAAMLLLPSLPTVDQWNNIVNAAKPSIVFTGTAAARQTGPLIGLVDIGVCEDAYLFRAALPGVRKDEGCRMFRVQCGPVWGQQCLLDSIKVKSFLWKCVPFPVKSLRR